MTTRISTHIILRSTEMLHVLEPRRTLIKALHHAWEERSYGIDLPVGVPLPNECWKEVRFFVTLHIIAGVGEEHDITWKDLPSEPTIPPPAPEQTLEVVLS